MARWLDKDTARLVDSWERWLDVVYRFAKGDWRRRRVNRDTYRRLHQDLLEKTNQYLRSQRSAQLRSLLEQAKPWISVESLSQADREILLRVYAQGQQAVREIRGKRDIWRKLRRPVTSVLTIAAIVAGLWVGTALWTREPVTDFSVERLQTRVRILRYRIQEASFTQKFMVIGGVGSLVAILFVWRSGRKY